MAPLEIRHRSVRPISAKHAQASRFLQQSRPAHLLTMAPTRSGKGVGTIIPNLLTIDRSVICIDPKGENARVTARTRATKGTGWCLDPFGVSGQPAARHNPLARPSPPTPGTAHDPRPPASA